METKESKQSDGNAKKADNSKSSKEDQLVENHSVEGTPFTVWKMNNGWFLSMGKYRLSEVFKTREEAEQDAKDASWIRVMQIIRIVVTEMEEEKSKGIPKTYQKNQLTLNGK